MQRLTQFGIGNNKILFADYPQLYQLDISPDKFSEQEVKSMALAGLDGVVLTNPRSRGRTKDVNLSMRWRYAGDDTTDYKAVKSAFAKMKNWGLTYLFGELEDDTLVFTLAQCTKTPFDGAKDQQAHIWQQGTFEFICPKVRWYTRTNMAFLDNGQALDDTLTLIAPQIDSQTYNDSDTFNVTNNGDAPAGVYIWFEAPSGETVTNPSLSRLSEDGINNADQVTYNGTLEDGDVVVLDSRNWEAQLNFTAFTPTNFENVSFLRSCWLEIPPGTHTIKVNGTFSNGVILTFEFWDTYY